MLLYIHLNINHVIDFSPVLPASRFMAYHTPLTNSQEYTAALLMARELAYNITMGMRKIPGTSPDFEVFPYTYVHVFPRLFHVSCFTKHIGVGHSFSTLFFFPPSSRLTYVFYEQYLTIVPEGLFNISICLLPTFVVCCLLLGLDLRSGLLNLLTIIMIVVDTVGVMTLWGIDYNAVALINLVTVRTILIIIIIIINIMIIIRILLLFTSSQYLYDGLLPYFFYCHLFLFCTSSSFTLCILYLFM